MHCQRYFEAAADGARHDADDALVHAVKDPSANAGRASLADDAAREVVSRESNALAGATDSVLEQSLPRKYVSDSGYALGETAPELDLCDVLNKSPPPAREAITGMVAGLLRNFGSHSRAFVRSLLARSQQGR
jgi:hypothetical protein